MEGGKAKDPTKNVKFISQLYYVPTDHMKVLRWFDNLKWALITIPIKTVFDP
jgi:hypothetical protein